MTKKDLRGIKMTIIGAAVFIGGCVLMNTEIGLCVVIAGGLIMGHGLNMGNDTPDDKKDKEENTNEPN